MSTKIKVSSKDNVFQANTPYLILILHFLQIFQLQSILKSMFTVNMLHVHTLHTVHSGQDKFKYCNIT